MKTLSHLLLILLLPVCALAQDYKRTYNWYFGDSLGLNFATDPPTLLPKGSLSNAEGSSAVISDTNGQLLFYTDGQTVWNRNHTTMQNGTGLNGSWDATQPAVIVPQPGNDSLYYVFTVDRLGLSKGLQYSIVNMFGDNGLGAVTTKNVLLQTPVCEKLAATYHQNGTDIWVLAHGFGNNTFYCYLITKNGVVDCPVLNNTGAMHGPQYVTSAQGQMKFSIDGKKLCVTVFNSDNSKIDLFDFDNATGKLQNHIPISNIYLPFGIEFSTNVKHIYACTRGNELIAYDLSQNNTTDIENSKTILVDYQNTGWMPTVLQLATDSKIYLTYPDSFHLGEISYPDSGSNKAGYKVFSIITGSKKTKFGLPNFISSYFHRPSLDFIYERACTSLSTKFNCKTDTATNASCQWRIKRLANNTTSLLNIKSFTYTFPDSGLYEVQLISNSDTVTKTILIDAPILPTTDTLGCGVDSVVIKVPSYYRCIQWSDTSATLYSRTIKTNGTYIIQGYNSHGCFITDSIKINFSPSPQLPVISKVNDSLYSSKAFSYQWYLNDTAITGVNNQSIKPIVAGIYKVLITDSNGCSNISSPFSSNVGTLDIDNNSVTIYPNPATNLLFVELSKLKSEYDYSIMRITDQQLLSGKLSASLNEINTSSLLPGIYFIQIKNLNNTYRKKLIIQ